MKKNLVVRINDKKEAYELAWKDLSRSELCRALDHEWKKIRSDFQYDSMQSYSDYHLGTERHYSFGERPSLSKSERPTYESYKKMCMERKDNLITGLIAVYLAAEERIRNRSFWDKVLHPVTTYRENRTFAYLKETMENYGITEDVLEDYENSSLTIDEAVRFSEAVDIDEKKPEMENFINANFEAKIDAVYLV